jgi:uncharacterized protein Yka (UPF0111/DUF47 family)
MSVRHAKTRSSIMLITYMARNLACFVVVHNAIQQLEQGVEDLIQGHVGACPHQFVREIT